MQWQTHTHTHTHTHSITRDPQDGWSLGQGSDAGLTHVSVAHPLIKLTGNEHREHAVGVESAGKGKHTHTVSLVIHSVDGAPCKDRIQT